MLLQTSPGNQDPFDYLIKQHPSPIDLPKRYRQTCPPRISQEPVGSADAEFFKASRVSRSGVGRVDNGRPILKVTLYVAENPGDRVAHNFLDTPPGYLAPPTCSPPPPLPIYGEKTRGGILLRVAVDRFKSLAVPSSPSRGRRWTQR